MTTSLCFVQHDGGLFLSLPAFRWQTQGRVLKRQVCVTLDGCDGDEGLVPSVLGMDATLPRVKG